MLRYKVEERAHDLGSHNRIVTVTNAWTPLIDYPTVEATKLKNLYKYGRSLNSVDTGCPHEL